MEGVFPARVVVAPAEARFVLEELSGAGGRQMIGAIIVRRGLTQVVAAEVLDQPKVSALTRGRLS